MVHLGLLDTASTFVLASTPPVMAVNELAARPATLVRGEHRVVLGTLPEDAAKCSLVLASGIEF